MADQAPSPPQIHMIDPSGNVTPVDADQAVAARGLGYVPASPQQISDYQQAQAIHEQYGTLPQQALTFAESVASMATFGGTSALEAMTPGLAEEAAARKAENPITGMLGSALPIVAGVGAPALIEKAGTKAVQGLTGLVPELGVAARVAAGPLAEGTGVGARIAAKALTEGVRGSTVLGLYGLGQNIDEAALGGAPLTAQSIAAHMGLSALVGGALGVGGGAISVALPELFGKARAAVGTVVQSAKNAYPELAERLGVGDADTIREAMAKYGETFKSPKEVYAMQRDLGESIEDLANQMAGAQKELYGAARPVETEELLAAQDPVELATKAAAKREAFSASLTQAIAEIQKEPDLVRQGLSGEVEKILDGFSRRTDGAPPLEVFENLRTARQQLDELSSWAKVNRDLPPMAQRNAVQIARGLRGEAKAALVDESAWGPAAARQAALDAAHSDYAQSIRVLTSGKLSPLNSNILRKTMVNGQEVLQVNPRVLKTFLNQMADARSAGIADTLNDFIGASHNFLNEMQTSFEHVPSADFDAKALGNLIDRAGNITAQARRQASATQLLNELNPEAGFGAGGARALLPQGSKAGVAEGLGIAALAPMVSGAFPGAGAVAGLYGAGKAAYNAVQQVKNVPQMIATLTKLERMTQDVGATIDRGVSGLVAAGAKAGRVGRGEVAAGLASTFGKSPADAAKQFQKRVTDVQKLAQDPNAMQDTLTAQTDGWHDHAPKTAQALNVTTAQTVAFLASKVPRNPAPGPLAKVGPTSQADIAKFNRYYEAAEDPLSVIRHAKAGTLSQEEVDTLRACYPQLYGQVLTKLAEKAAVAKDLPYRTRSMIALLAGQDVDGSLTPASLLINQTAHAAPIASQGAQMAQNQARPSKSGAGKITKAKLAATGPQSLAMNEEA